MKKTFSDEDLVKNLSLYYMNRHLKKKPIEKYHRQIDSSPLHDREKYRKKSEILLLNAFMHHFPQVQFHKKSSSFRIINRLPVYNTIVYLECKPKI